MTDRLFAHLIAALLRFIAADPARVMAFRRELLKILQSKEPEHVAQGTLSIAKQIELLYDTDSS